MSRLHFQLRAETHALLTEGIELPSTWKARVEAARLNGTMRTDHAAEL